MKHLLLLSIIFISYSTCAQNVGVGNISPQEKLEVSGAVRIGNTFSNNPGTIRYGTDNQFKANENGTWRSVIASGSSYFFGGFVSTVRNAEVLTPYQITVPDDGQYMIILTSDMENSQNYSSGPYDVHGYIYLRAGAATLMTHHALKNEMEITSTGYTISLVAAEFPKITAANLTKNSVLTVYARLDATGVPAPTSNWNIYSLNIILVKLN